MHVVVLQMALPSVVQCSACEAIVRSPAQLSEPEALAISPLWAIFSKVLKRRPFKQMYDTENLGQASNSNRTIILISILLSFAT